MKNKVMRCYIYINWAAKKQNKKKKKAFKLLKKYTS